MIYPVQIWISIYCPGVANEHGQQIESLQSSIAALRDELESAADKKLIEESLTEENSALKNENYKLQEELMKLRG